MSDEPHTSIRTDRPGLEKAPAAPAGFENVIVAAQPHPVVAGLRYRLNHPLLGKLEKLAKARFELGALVALDQALWRPTAQDMELLVQSVVASSAIEGEAIGAEEVPLVLAAVTQGESGIQNPELTQRQLAVAEISNALIWALDAAPSEFISLDFVTELHRRMFKSTKEDAGQLKSREVVIRGGKYNVSTLAPEQTRDFTDELCRRTNNQLRAAEVRQTSSMFLRIAEFLCDFLAIHPFHDGNGRTARVLSTYLLERCGYQFARFYPLDTIIMEQRSQYYQALFLAQKNWYSEDEDMTPWIAFYTDTVYEQFRRAYQKIADAKQRDGANPPD